MWTSRRCFINTIYWLFKPWAWQARFEIDFRSVWYAVRYMPNLVALAFIISEICAFIQTTGSQIDNRDLCDTCARIFILSAVWHISFCLSIPFYERLQSLQGIQRNRSIYTLNIVMVFDVVANVNMAYILLISPISICFISITLVRLEQDTDTDTQIQRRCVCVRVSCSDKLEANCISLPYSNAVIWLNAPYRYRQQATDTDTDTDTWTEAGHLL